MVTLFNYPPLAISLGRVNLDTKQTTMKEFKEGDYVHCKLWGYGHVIKILDPKEHKRPIIFESRCGTHGKYTEDGCPYSCSPQTLRHADDVTELNQKIIEVKDSGRWVKRVLIKVLEDGTAVCWIYAQNILQAKNENLTYCYKPNDWREIEDKPDDMQARAKWSDEHATEIALTSPMWNQDDDE